MKSNDYDIASIGSLTRILLPPSSRLVSVETLWNPVIFDIRFWTKYMVFKDTRWSSVSGTARKRLKERSRMLDGENSVRYATKINV